MKLICEMEMPKDCPMCPMAHYNKLDEFTGCEVAAGKLFAVTRDKAYAESTCRPSWCPIVGVLPDEHGDLIDRDFICKDIQLWKSTATDTITMGFLHHVEILLMSARPIITAERKDDEQIH